MKIRSIAENVSTGLLTRTQREVVQSLGEGLTAEDIAARRHRSVGTIRKHIEQARERLGARNIAHLIRLSLLRGLIRCVVWFLVLTLVCQWDQPRRRSRSTRSFSVVSGRVFRREV